MIFFLIFLNLKFIWHLSFVVFGFAMLGFRIFCNQNGAREVL